MKCDRCAREMRPDELNEIIVDGLQILHCSTRCAFIGGMRFAAALAVEQIDQLPDEIQKVSFQVLPVTAKGSTEGGAL